jgi:hypothetical protein
MGRIYDSITALNEFASISFNEPYQMPPTYQGTYNIGAQMTNEATPPVFEYSRGPFPGEGSWRFTTVGGVYNTRIKNQSTFGTRNSLHELVNSNNYTVGFWIKINSVSGATAVGIQRAVTTEGGGTNSQYSIGISYRNLDGNPANPFTYGFSYQNTTNGTQFVERDENNNLIQPGKWYFLTLQVSYVSIDGVPTRYTDFYINGVSKIYYATSNFTTPGYINQLNWGFTSGGAASVDFNIADWFIGTAANIQYPQIQSVWNASKPIQLPLKYYDGTTWQDPTDKKIYYDNQWNPIYANQWNGTSWVQV